MSRSLNEGHRKRTFDATGVRAESSCRRDVTSTLCHTVSQGAGSRTVRGDGVGICAVMVQSTQTTVRSLLRDLQAGNRAALSERLSPCMTSCRLGETPAAPPLARGRSDGPCARWEDRSYRLRAIVSRS